MFRGTYTALVTPFRDGRVDEDALCTLIDEQIAAGVEGVVPCGSTGESATLSHDEHARVVNLTIKQARGRTKVIAGTGSNNTHEACQLTRAAADAGADGALLISPYYNKPTQHGHVEHYKAIAAASDLPLIVYNIPGRTGINMTAETIARLAEVPHIVGVKESSGNVDQWLRILQLCGPEFDVLCGDDAAAVPLIAVGGCGVISVMSNIVPARVKAHIDAALAGDFARASKLLFELLPLFQFIGVEVNPIPIKAAMGMMGKIANELRLPLTPISPEPEQKVREALVSQGLLDA